jgi:uncharacterized membrane protein
MKLRFQHALNVWRASYFTVPMLLCVLGIVLSFVFVAFDRALIERRGAALSGWEWIFSGGADGARTVLSTIASSIITVAGVAYSITIAALVLASTQFGPRLLRNFLEDRVSQWVLGSFVGTFLFCALVLRTVRSESDGGIFVPQLSVSCAIVLTIACLLLLVYFFHHVAMSIQAPAIVAGVSRELHGHIDRIFPRGVGRGEPRDASVVPGSELPSDYQERSLAVLSTEYGYLQAVDIERLFNAARADDCVVILGFRPGDFVAQDAPLARVYPRERAGEKWEKRVREAFYVGVGRTPFQDIEFGVNQLVEVACRALSPAINDPFTAMACLDHLGSALVHLLQVKLPSPHRYDEDDRLRLVAERISFEGLCDAAFNMIRQYGQNSASVMIRLLETIAAVAPHADEPHEKHALRHHAEMSLRDCCAVLPDERDRADVQERYAQVLAALEAVPTAAK